MTSQPRHTDVASAHGHAPLSFGPFRLDRAARQLWRSGEPVRIGSRALDILVALVERAGEVVSGSELREIVWRGTFVEDAGLRVHISSLRRALGDGRDGARYIVNVTGRGYSFVAPIAHDESDTPAPSRLEEPRRESRWPPPPRSLIGRRDAVQALSELLLARRFVTIVGSGGIGKTTVAAAIADGLRTEFGFENIVFVDFGAVSNPGLVPEAVISAIGCTIGSADPVEGLLSFVADKRMLIVFDSCEHLLDSTSLLASRLFHDAAGVHLLVTSRESLRVPGETVYVLGPLAYPLDEFPTAAEALAMPAVQLLMDRAEFSGFDEELTDAAAPKASEICRRADGIPLAIELAGSRIGAFGIRGVADLLARNLELTLAGWRNAAPRHRTLEAMLDWSFKLLSDDEQRILSRLSVFVGRFTMEAACFVAAEREGEAADVAAAVASLVHKSLVWIHPANETVLYRLPDTTRAYAATKLKEIEAPEPVFRRHARYFADLFRGIALEHGAYAGIGRYAPHIGNVRRALEWSFSDDESRVIGVELAADAAPLFFGVSLISEGRHWTRLALGTTDEVTTVPGRDARLLEALALSSIDAEGNAQEFRQAIEQGLKGSGAGDGESTQLRLVAGLGDFLIALGDFEGGFAAAKRCRAITERGGTPSERIISELFVAAGHHLTGDQAAAVNHCERAFKRAAELGHSQIHFLGYDHCLRAELTLARSLWLVGSPTRACRLVLDAMDRAMHSPLPSAYSMTAHGVPVLFWSGNTEKSGEHIEQLMAHAEKNHFRLHEAEVWALKGEWLLMSGDAPGAVETLRRALTMLYREQYRMVIPPAARSLAAGLAECGDHVEARETIAGAISSAPEMGQRFWLPELLRTQGEIILKGPSPDTATAESVFRRSMQIARELGATGWELKTAIRLSRLLVEQGRAVEALTVLEPIFEAQSDRTGTTDLVAAAELLESLKRRPGSSQDARPRRRASVPLAATGRS